MDVTIRAMIQHSSSSGVGHGWFTYQRLAGILCQRGVFVGLAVTGPVDQPSSPGARALARLARPHRRRDCRSGTRFESIGTSRIRCAFAAGHARAVEIIQAKVPEASHSPLSVRFGSGPSPQ